MKKKWSSDLVILFVVGVFFTLAWWVFSVGASGPFLLDDNVILDAYTKFGGVTDFSTFKHFVFDFGPTVLGRPVSFLSFLLNDQFLPSSPYDFKHTNIFIHLVNGLLLFLLLLRLGGIVYGHSLKLTVVSAIMTSVWLVLPMHTSTIFYVVQRMAQLAWMFSLISILFYLSAYRDNSIHRFTKIVCFLISAAAAVLSKESGVLVFVYLAIIQILFLNRFVECKLEGLFKWLFVFIPCLLLFAYIVSSFDKFSASYIYRSFSMQERLLTESRILWDYIAQIIFPRLSGLGLFHDDIQLSRSLFDPVSTIFSVLGHGLALVLAFKLRTKNVLISSGIFWFYGAHLLESTIIPLELYFEHRNYGASFGVLMVLLGLIKVAASRIEEVYLKPLPYVFGCSFLILCTVMTYQASRTWSSEESIYSTWAMEHEDSKRAQSSWLKYIYEEKNYLRAYELSYSLVQQFENDLGLRLNHIAAACRVGRNQAYPLNDILENATALAVEEGTIQSFLHLEDLILNHVCSDLDNGAIHSLYHAMRQIDRKRGHWKSTLYANEAEVYVKEGNLKGALDALDKAIEFNPRADMYMRQVVLLLSAGLNDLAKERLALAYEANARRSRYVSDMTESLDTLSNRVP